MSDELRPKVGFGVIIYKDGKVLFGRRGKGASHSEQTWCCPGGLLEHGETFEEGVRREAMEEAGVEIENIRFVVAMNQLGFLPKHYVGLGFMADWKSGEPRPEEGDKMTDWGWFDPDYLPEPVYQPSKQVIDSHRDGSKFVEMK
jgi:8-oxo-dGTP diphosphatase